MQRFGKYVMIAFLIVAGSIFAMSTASPTADAAPAARPALQRATSLKLAPIADAYVDPSTPSTNYGNDGALRTYAQSLTAVMQSEALLQFDLSAIPAGSIIDKATLTLHQYVATGQDSWALSIERVTQGWGESDVSYRAKPPSEGTGLALVSPLNENVEVSTDLTSLVRQWVYQPFAYPNNEILLR
ncbi:MAG: DNRLRE domain-containing protein, partial [Caldilineaceae bacterium]|nr:DNRLRE domain-containing protein [Caldilineaceae bacterium]